MTTDQTPIHAQPVDRVLERQNVQRDRGLDEPEVQRRRREHGRNRLARAPRRSWWSILLGQFRSVVILVLCAAAVAAFATARLPEGIALVAVVAVNTAIGFFSEWQAVSSMQALRRRTEHPARVRRDGEARQIPAGDLVPGDILLLTAGRIVAADARLIEVDRLRVDEAALTGESVPVTKSPEPVEADAPLAERPGMVFKGTGVAEGGGEAVVTATGAQTELGRIAALAEQAEAAQTPLQRRLDRLGRRLAWITLAVAAVIAAAGLYAGQEMLLMIETAIALGVAAIPEGLPIVATIALARGMYLMARRNAVINHLPAVETLGATRVIFTDKTGTLTENRMTLRRIVTEAGEQTIDDEAAEKLPELARRVLEVGVLCNNAELPGHRHDADADADESAPPDPPAATGNPEEIALRRAGEAAGLDPERIAGPRVREEPFDHETMMMATFHESDDGALVAVKGAPQAVLDACSHFVAEDGEPRKLDDEARRRWDAAADRLAGEGLRLLAVAEKRAESKDADPYANLRFLGLVGLLDPPREDVKEAIDTCQRAGIAVEMVTGDKPETALAVAEQVGIIGGPEDPEAGVMTGPELADLADDDPEAGERIHRSNIFARIEPAQKLRLVETYQRWGEVVAMTGDGINDAPALKKADIGVAMGRRGTEAARQVADMVLRDDRLSSIVAAVEQGRVIFGNIRRSVVFMLCTNVAEVLAVAVASLAKWTLPLRPLQILYLNVLTDVLPALALGVGRGSAGIMQRPPRDPGESVLTRRHWSEIAGFSAVIAACVLAGLLIAERILKLDTLAAVTVAFLTLAFSKLWFTFVLRSPASGVFDNELTRNRWVWAAIAVCAGLLVAAVYLPGLADVLETRPLPWTGWALVLGLSAAPLLVGQVTRQVQRGMGLKE